MPLDSGARGGQPRLSGRSEYRGEKYNKISALKKHKQNKTM